MPFEKISHHQEPPPKSKKEALKDWQTNLQQRLDDRLAKNADPKISTREIRFGASEERLITEYEKTGWKLIFRGPKTLEMKNIRADGYEQLEIVEINDRTKLIFGK